MAHGTPDWGWTGPKETTYALDDLGEHAVRLGSPHLWDRRGDVLYSSDFRDGMGMLYGGVSGLGAVVNLWTGASRQGAYSVRLLTGSTANWSANIAGMLPLPVSSRIGFEISFSMDPQTTMWDFEIHWLDGAYLHECQIRYDDALGTLWILTGMGLGQFATHPYRLYEAPRPCHTFKMVADIAANTYVRCILDDALYDLLAYAPQTALNAALPRLFVMAEHMGAAAANVPAWIDNLIVTQNEP